MRFLFSGAGKADRSVIYDLCKTTQLPKAEPEVGLTRIETLGTKEGVTGSRVTESINATVEDKNPSAVMRTSAFPISIIAALIASKKIADKGAVCPKESIPRARFPEKKRGAVVKKEKLQGSRGN